MFRMFLVLAALLIAIFAGAASVDGQATLMAHHEEGHNCVDTPEGEICEEVEEPECDPNDCSNPIPEPPIQPPPRPIEYCFGHVEGADNVHYLCF